MHLVPENIQLAGNDLAIKWNDGRESYLELEALRRACPCAGCQGEPDVVGHIDKPHVSYDQARSFRLTAYVIVGGYAWQPTWGDSHSTGLYTFDLLRRLDPLGSQPIAA